MPAEQSAGNFASRDTAHMAALLILAGNVIVAVVYTVARGRNDLYLHLWLIVVAIALVLSSLRARTNPILLQDRLIHLEERLRYATLLSHTEATAALALPLPKLIALRFASDAELPGLVAATLAEDLAPRQIRERIQVWRPDTHRV